jgi:hypothetical protein
MELLNSFISQGMIAQIGEIVLFANTVTMAMPTRWKRKHDDGLHFKNPQLLGYEHR